MILLYAPQQLAGPWFSSSAPWSLWGFTTSFYALRGTMTPTEGTGALHNLHAYALTGRVCRERISIPPGRHRW